MRQSRHLLGMQEVREEAPVSELEEVQESYASMREKLARLTVENNRLKLLMNSVYGKTLHTEIAGIDGCIAIVEQSLATVRAEYEDNPESQVMPISIHARESILALLRGYRSRTALASTEEHDRE